jgi:NAD(P)-dependent dehydrogenase (short-subunit alcohol dehydrogenase family)
VVIADRIAPPATRSRFVETDVGDESAVARLIDDVAATEGRLDALICNAGFMIRKPIGELTLAEWSAVIATNLTSSFLLVRAAQKLLAASLGAVVTIASTRAAMSEKNTESYSASKGGLVALTHALAISLGPAIRVNCISPGWINTTEEALDAAEHAQHPAGRVGTPDDVAGLVAYLVGPEAGFITGAEFTIDGGMTRKMIYD